MKMQNIIRNGKRILAFSTVAITTIPHPGFANSWKPNPNVCDPSKPSSSCINRAPVPIRISCDYKVPAGCRLNQDRIGKSFTCGEIVETREEGFLKVVGDRADYVAYEYTNDRGIKVCEAWLTNFIRRNKKWTETAPESGDRDDYDYYLDLRYGLIASENRQRELVPTRATLLYIFRHEISTKVTNNSGGRVNKNSFKSYSEARSGGSFVDGERAHNVSHEISINGQESECYYEGYHGKTENGKWGWVVKPFTRYDCPY